MSDRKIIGAGDYENCQRLIFFFFNQNMKLLSSDMLRNYKFNWIKIKYHLISKYYLKILEHIIEIKINDAAQK